MLRRKKFRDLSQKTDLLTTNVLLVNINLFDKLKSIRVKSEEIKN